LEFGELFFVEVGNRRNRRKNPAARREPTTNSTHKWHQAGIEPCPHWWKTSALTTRPSLLPRDNQHGATCEHLLSLFLLAFPIRFSED